MPQKKNGHLDPWHSGIPPLSRTRTTPRRPYIFPPHPAKHLRIHLSQSIEETKQWQNTLLSRLQVCWPLEAQQAISEPAQHLASWRESDWEPATLLLATASSKTKTTARNSRWEIVSCWLARRFRGLLRRGDERQCRLRWGLRARWRRGIIRRRLGSLGMGCRVDVLSM